MTAVARPNPVAWSGDMDSEGHRNYKVTYLVDTAATDGPASVLQAIGLPVIGAQWNLGTDVDIWAWRYPETTVKPTTQGETCTLWSAELRASTKPPNVNRCVDQQITNPLLIPPEVSGDFVKYTEEASYDRFGAPITNSAWEQIRGPKVEFDANRQTVKIKMNFPAFLDIVPAMVDSLNAFDLWGFPPRCIKLSKAPWERKFYGTCYVYFQYTFEFDIAVDPYTGASGFDREILDEGTKALNGAWLTSPGLGCTVTITVDSAGRVTNATLAAGGSGYLPLYTIQLIINGGGTGDAAQATVYANTNSSGVVVSVTQFGTGSGYAAGTKTTTPALAWTLFNINGNPPNPNNPSHFCRFKDQKGENTTVVLNGSGLPAGQIIAIPTTPPTTYISLQGGNQNHALTDTAWWLPLGRGPAPYDANTEYNAGDVVSFEFNVGTDPVTHLFVSTESQINVPPNPPTAGWVDILLTMSSRGLYVGINSYNRGDTVQDRSGLPSQSASGGAGSIFVQKYGESDFTLLGIPLAW